MKKKRQMGAANLNTRSQYCFFCVVCAVLGAVLCVFSRNAHGLVRVRQCLGARLGSSLAALIVPRSIVRPTARRYYT